MSTTTLKAVARYVRRLGERDLCALGDAQLLDRFLQRRDEAAYAELVRRHGPMVLALCRRVLRHEQDAEDVFQAAFLVLVRKAGSIREGQSVGGWLFQVAHRLALRARSGEQRRRQRLTALPDDATSAGEPRSEESWRPLLDDELRRLPEQYRSALVLCYLQGRTQAEAARLLSTTADAVNSRLRRARAVLRLRLARHGIAVSASALTLALTTGTAAAVAPALIQLTARTALAFAVNPASCGASTLAITLARGGSMSHTMNKILCGFVLLVGLVCCASAVLPRPALGDDPAKPAVTRGGQTEAPPREAAPQPDAKPDKPGKRRHCIILWMSGGPSQIDTFDPKPGQVNGGPIRAIDTATKGAQISEHLPRLARLTEHLAIIRSMTHREGDHARGTHLMRTGYPPDQATHYPPLGAILAKELPEAANLPKYVSIGANRRISPEAHGPGFLGPKYGPLFVAERTFAKGETDALALPPVEAFKDAGGDAAEKMRQTVAPAFDLDKEKDALRDAYGRNSFGQSCLLARRLVEQGVPVVEVTLDGWDTHTNNFQMVSSLSAKLDPAFASLLTDLRERKLLDKTLIVWMGEFGRTPRINVNDGRDHYPMAFSVVLAGGGIKGGQVIGRTSADGVQIEANPVTPAELYATIYQALGVDASRANLANTGRPVRLVEKGTTPIKGVLR